MWEHFQKIDIASYLQNCYDDIEIRNQFTKINYMTTREYTTEEVRKQFISAIKHSIDYWNTEDFHFDNNISDRRRRLEGLAHSILVLLDGGRADFPQCIVAPNPHPDDKSFLKSVGENWYPENDATKVNGNIGGGLHELLFQ